MAYIAPDADALKARFPEFAAVSDDLLELVLGEAAAQVGETWVERDRKLATLYLAAHLLASEGRDAAAAGVVGGDAVAGPLKRRKVGDVEAEFAGVSSSSGGGSGASEYGLTAYGQRFLEIMRRNFPAVAVV